MSALVHSVGESVRSGLTVVNAEVDVLAPPAESVPVTCTVYLVLNLSVAVDVQVTPTAVTFAPSVAVTTTGLAGATSLLFAAGVTVKSPVVAGLEVVVCGAPP